MSCFDGQGCVQADFKGAMKLVNSAEDQQLEAEQRLEESKKEIQRLQEVRQAAITVVP